MRVGLLIPGSLDTVTGGYLYDRRLLDHLASRGDEVEVVSLAAPRRTYARHLADNVSPALALRLAHERFDVLLQDELAHPSLVLLNRWLRLRDPYPIVTVVHLLRSCERSRSPLARVSTAVERRYLATVDAAVFNSETTRAAAERLVGRSLAGVVVYPGADHLGVGISDDEIMARAGAAGPLRVLSLANVVPGKGLHALVAALGRLPAGTWQLSVVGSLTTDRTYVRNLRRLISRLGVGAEVELLGPVPNTRVAHHLALGHVLAVPSSYEALGIAYLEAMRFGLPVIATSAGGAHEVVDDGREGFLVAPGDVDALTSALRGLADDRARLLRMALAARRRAERHPGWAQSFEVARDLLCSVAGAHRRDRRQRTSP